MFEHRYHTLAKNELERRKQANESMLRERRREFESKVPEYAKLRSVVASTGAEIAAVALEASDVDSKIAKLEDIQARHKSAAARIKELLLKANYPADYLEPIHSCKVCLDTGIAGRLRCDCYTNMVKRFAADGINSTSQLRLTGFENFDVNLHPDSVQDGSGLNPREVMRYNFEFCKNYAENFRLPYKGLLLTGQTGLGKTHLSLAIAGKVLDSGFGVIYGSAPDLFRKLENEHFGRNDGNTMEWLQSTELLVLDDIGAEFDKDFYLGFFYNLLNSRMESGKPTVINTNYTLGELTARYGDRIVSRFMTFEILQFCGCDVRMMKN